MKFQDIEIFEKDCIYEASVEVTNFNENGVLKPSSYQLLFAQVVGEHLNRFENNMSSTMQFGLAWALISQSYEIIRPINDSMKLYAQTWFSKRRGPYFRREIVFRNSDNETMFHGTSFSILLNLESRAIFRKKELPFQMNAPHEEFLMQADPSFKRNLSFTDIHKRKVYNSYIDRLGHVNNCRYSEFAYDALSEQEKIRLSRLKRMDAYFISEMCNRDIFTVQKSIETQQVLPNHDREIILRGQNDTKNNVAFAVVFSF